MFSIRDFLRDSNYKYYNLAIYVGVARGDLNKNILIQSFGGNSPKAFQELKRINSLSAYFKEHTPAGVPIPLYDGIIARCHEELASFILSGAESCEFIEIEKKYEPKIFDEVWLKSFLNDKEVLEVKDYFCLLMSCNNEPALDAVISEKLVQSSSH
jgi:hypothetical protein